MTVPPLPPAASIAPPTRARRSRWLSHDARTGWMFMAPFVIVFLLVFLVPIGTAIRSAFYTQAPAESGLFGGGALVEKFSGLKNFADVAGGETFWRGMARVVGYAGAQIPLMILIALTLALVLDSYLVKRAAGFRMAFFLPFAIPGIIAAMMWLYLYTPELSPFVKYLPDSVNLMSPNLILVSMANMTTWTYTGYNMLIFLAALQAIPRELDEAARIDGASGLQVALRIKVPILRNAALLAVLLSIIGTIQLFNEPTIMETANPWMGKAYTPMMMAYNSMLGQISPSGTGPASAISLLMALIAGGLAIGYALLQRGKAD